jgi:hypothetical protein
MKGRGTTMSYFQGTWKNEYGSIVTLEDGGNGYLYGTYVSSTGASGTYHIVGWGSTQSPTSGNGVGVSLALLWRSFQGGTPDPSWHWVSGFGGQGILDASGLPTMSLNHALVATDDDPGVGTVGTYLDKLLYRIQVLDTKPAKAKDHRGKRAKALGDPIEGSWVCASPPMSLSLTVEDQPSGFVGGTLTIGGQSVSCVGFADDDAQSGGIALEGLTITCIVNGQYVVFCGSLNLSSGALVLMQMMSTGTASGLAFMQTSAQWVTFVRG